jgi:hypothetical protein
VTGTHFVATSVCALSDRNKAAAVNGGPCVPCHRDVSKDFEEGALCSVRSLRTDISIEVYSLTLRLNQPGCDQDIHHSGRETQAKAILEEFAKRDNRFITGRICLSQFRVTACRIRWLPLRAFRILRVRKGAYRRRSALEDMLWELRPPIRTCWSHRLRRSLTQAAKRSDLSQCRIISGRSKIPFREYRR